MRTRPRAAGTILVVSAVLALAPGCGPSVPLDTRVTATDSLSLSLARAEAQQALTPQQMEDFDKAIQEIKLHIMAAGTAHGSEAVSEALYQSINGHTLRSIIQMGLESEYTRAEFERSTLEKSMATNALMRTRPGDTDSAAYLSDLRERQTARLKAATEEVRHVRERLAASGDPVDPPSPTPPG
ncbi:MAG TPA: hypothetical protein VII09_11285 [Opitutaceae bacterium]